MLSKSCTHARTHMPTAYTCSFEGHAGPRITVPVHVGQAIDPLVLSPIPWNCFFPDLRLSTPLPRNITLQQQQQHQQPGVGTADSTAAAATGTQPAVAGTVVAPFDTIATEVTLACSGIQTFSCGVLVLQACAAQPNASACLRNQCAWCADAAAAPAGGTCGFCTAAFDAACWRRTGARAVCAAAHAWDTR